MITGTKGLLLKEAERLMRTRGFASFSFADLSELVGIQPSSIHHHFATKETLGCALVDACLVTFGEELQNILDTELSAEGRLSRYADVFLRSLRDGMLPFCGSSSAAMATLPKSMQKRVRCLFELHIKWLNRVVGEGVAAGEVRRDLNVDAISELILSALEGASLVAWATEKGTIIPTTARTLKHVLAVPAPDGTPRGRRPSAKISPSLRIDTRTARGSAR